MTEQYSEYLTPIRKRLESLRNAIEQDFPRLEEGALDLTFRQVIDLTAGLDSALEAYKGAMSPFYRTAKRTRSGSGEGTSYYQRRRQQEEQVARLAQEGITRQGYVTEAAIAAETGYRDTTVTRVLQGLAEKQGWERKRDRETKSYRYSPKPSPDTPASPSTQ